ncbi:hypothetical protein, partial [Rhizohabitans arisaemae]|uniref:hypothetical protein n=1 Tax=Rhizohabitans arisaemae TaxID=2720610 RepID=UPI0024B18B54
MAVVLTATLVQGAPATPAHADPAATELETLTTRLHAVAVQMKSAKAGHDVLLSEYLVSLALASPGLTEAEYLSRYQDASAGVSSKLAEAPEVKTRLDLLRRIAKIGQVLPGMAGVAAPLKAGLVEMGAQPISPYNNWDEALATQTSTSREIEHLLDGLNVFAAGRVRRMAQELGADHPAVRVWNSQIGVRSGITAVTVLQDLLADPVIKEVAGLTEVLKYPAGDPRRRQALDARVAHLLALTNQNVDAAVRAIDELQNGYDGAFLWKTSAPPAPTCPAPRNPAACKTPLEKAEEDAAKRREVLKGLAEGFKAATTVMGWFDKEAEKQTRYLSDAALKIANAINDFLPVIAAKGFSDALFSLGSVVLTGNILGAVGALLPLFQAGQPSAEAQTLIELGKLRQEVNDLHIAMIKQFDAVNKNLNLIYTEMLARFGEVLRLQQVTIDQLYQIQDQLHTIEQKVDVWSSEIIKALQNGALQDANTILNGYLRRASGKPVPTYEHYSTAASLVYSAAVERTMESPLIPDPGGYADHLANPVALLDLHRGTGGAAGFLSWYGKERYKWPDQVAVVPNAAAWLSMANGYRHLSVENAAFASRLVATHGAAVAATGLAVNAAVQRFSQALDKPGADGTYTNALYRGLVADYKTAAG